MKLAVNSEHRQYFRKNNHIEFDGLLNPVQLEEINRGLENVLAGRLNVKPQNVFRELPEKTFAAGRDVWRQDETLKKYVINKGLAEIASELIEYKPLRLAYDQFYPSIAHTPSVLFEGPYRSLIMQPRSLKEISCIQGLLCGLVLCLTGEPETETKEGSIFPRTAGNGTFFNVEAVLDFHELFQEQTHRYLMIVYTHATSMYLLEENDPQTHDLKRQGYVFGDKLLDKLNPLVYR